MGRRWDIRIGLGGLGLLSLLGYGVAFPALAGSGARGLGGYVGLSLGLFVLYLLAAWLVLRRPSGERTGLAMILGFGLLFRLVLLPTPVMLSTDLYRYLWDGRVQWAGINPYRYAPAAEELAPLREPGIAPLINRPTKHTVYPPGAQAAFALVAAIAPNSILGWRLFVLGCEVGTVVLLLGLLRRTGVSPAAILLYAWAPLVIFEGVQAGHVDVTLLPALLLALSWRQEGKMARAGAALGAAILIKLYPAVLLPAWWRRGEWRFPAACVAVVAAGYLPYSLGVGRGVVGFLPEYFGSAEDFNVGLRFFLTEGIRLEGEVARGIAMLLLFGVLLLVLLLIARGRTEDSPGIFRAGMAAVAAYLVLVPTAMHPWYAVWIVPFLAVRPSPAFLWLTGALVLSYLKYFWEPAGLPLWARAVEFLPLYGLLVWEWRTGRAALASSGHRRGWRPGVAPNAP
ncbi:MAG: glycosyltransferase 87 family protein [candidate division NC10 bacterium]|nr:glycosyltransferase 87 family protein [candidate division NC10 bacterium]